MDLLGDQLFMLGDITGKKRAASAAEANAIESLIDMSNAAQRALQMALDAIRAELTGAQLENTIIALAKHLGIKRVEIGTIRAIKAVLAKLAWPDKFKLDKDAWSAHNASEKRYFEYKRKIAQVLELQQPRNTTADASTSGSVSGSGAGGSQSGNVNVSAAGDSLDASNQYRSATADGPHDSPPDTERMSQFNPDFNNSLQWLPLDPDLGSDLLELSDHEIMELCSVHYDTNLDWL